MLSNKKRLIYYRNIHSFVSIPLCKCGRDRRDGRALTKFAKQNLVLLGAAAQTGSLKTCHRLCFLNGLSPRKVESKREQFCAKCTTKTCETRSA